jgi:hypothetical protein
MFPYCLSCADNQMAVPYLLRQERLISAQLTPSPPERRVVAMRTNPSHELLSLGRIDR